jgi:hypothetical protein
LGLDGVDPDVQRLPDGHVFFQHRVEAFVDGIEWQVLRCGDEACSIGEMTEVCRLDATTGVMYVAIEDDGTCRQVEEPTPSPTPGATTPS